jgi:hypothetical protein
LAVFYHDVLDDDTLDAINFFRSIRDPFSIDYAAVVIFEDEGGTRLEGEVRVIDLGAMRKVGGIDRCWIGSGLARAT